MNSAFNKRMTNKDQAQDNVATYFDNLKHLIQTNDGTRSFIYRTVDCTDQAAPFNENKETRIAITHPDHMISKITDGFLTLFSSLIPPFTQRLNAHVKTSFFYPGTQKSTGQHFQSFLQPVPMFLVPS